MMTRYLSLGVALMIASMLVGCDSLNDTQYVIAGASVSDRATIKRSVRSSAIAAGLTDRPATFNVRNTIAYYLEPVQHFPVGLGARMVDDSAIVDLTCFHPGVGKPPAFRTAESLLTKTLTQGFGERLTMPDYGHIVR